MKFCKNLQRVVDISDPEWAPYWTNYKMLKVSSPDPWLDCLSAKSSHCDVPCVRKRADFRIDRFRRIYGFFVVFRPQFVVQNINSLN